MLIGAKGGGDHGRWGWGLRVGGLRVNETVGLCGTWLVVEFACTRIRLEAEAAADVMIRLALFEGVWELRNND